MNWYHIAISVLVPIAIVGWVYGFLWKSQYNVVRGYLLSHIEWSAQRVNELTEQNMKLSSWIVTAQRQGLEGHTAAYEEPESYSLHDADLEEMKRLAVVEADVQEAELLQKVRAAMAEEASE